MKRTQGISTVGAALVSAVVVGGGAGAFAWHQHQNLMQARGELTETRAQLQGAQASAATARKQLDAIRKELDEQKIALDAARMERDSAKVLLEAEKQHGERIRAELTQAREQLALVRGRQMPAYAAPRPVQPQVIRVVPSAVLPGGSGASPAYSQRATPPQ